MTSLDLKVTGLLEMHSIDILCAQLTRDMFAIAKFLLTLNCIRSKQNAEDEIMEIER